LKWKEFWLKEKRIQPCNNNGRQNVHIYLHLFQNIKVKKLSIFKRSYRIYKRIFKNFKWVKIFYLSRMLNIKNSSIFMRGSRQKTMKLSIILYSMKIMLLKSWSEVLLVGNIKNQITIRMVKNVCKVILIVFEINFWVMYYI